MALPRMSAKSDAQQPVNPLHRWGKSASLTSVFDLALNAYYPFVKGDVLVAR